MSVSRECDFRSNKDNEGERVQEEYIYKGLDVRNKQEDNFEKGNLWVFLSEKVVGSLTCVLGF